MDQERESGAERLPKESYREAKEGQREAREGQRKASGANRGPKGGNRWPKEASGGFGSCGLTKCAGPRKGFAKAGKKKATGKESKKRAAVHPKHAQPGAADIEDALGAKYRRPRLMGPAFACLVERLL